MRFNGGKCALVLLMMLLTYGWWLSNDLYRGASLRFFNSGKDMSAHGQRFYATSFKAGRARYICFELDLSYWRQFRRRSLNLTSVWRQKDGAELYREQHHFQVQPGWQGSVHASGWGDSEPGSWNRGSYYVEIFDGERRITRGKFVVY